MLKKKKWTTEMYLFELKGQNNNDSKAIHSYDIETVEIYIFNIIQCNFQTLNLQEKKHWTVIKLFSTYIIVMPKIFIDLLNIVYFWNSPVEQ